MSSTTASPSAGSASRGAGISTPIVSVIDRSFLWLAGTALLALLVYYLVGIDEGMTSIFGKTLVIHEFVHDSRHFLGFPCH